MSVGMFSVLPVPKQHWDERFCCWVIPFFPVVGGLIGVIWYVAAIFATQLPPLLYSVFILLIPFFLSGFLHLDGFIDTADAFFSRRSLEEKRRILKDPHVGAFAVIALICFLLIQFCVIQTIIAEKKIGFSFIFIPIISRCVTGIALLNKKPMAETGYMVLFKTNTKPVHTFFIAVIFIATLIFAFLFGGGTMLMTLGAVMISAWLTMVYLDRQFQGLSGDLCGCTISVSELSGLFYIAVS
ncbi:MAG: adenosylcobinamide-GDP ribazoletransferase [Planctomycetaceae bacterium]|jgi:adenosylcobinamide-GDP ribazoletransferase|nr:adenosylcobinamide-GDP ribazoletransferase [Planctomycetaceae bacterium]